MTLDFTPTAADWSAAGRTIRGWRRLPRPLPLDLAVDAVAPRRLAHLVEEALRAVAGGRGLWRFTTADAPLLAAALDAIDDLEKTAAARGGRQARTRLCAPDDLTPPQGSATRSRGQEGRS